MTEHPDVPPIGGPPQEVGDGLALLDWLAHRRNKTPVWEDPETGSFHVFRHADAVAVLSDPGVFSSDFSAMAPPPDPDLQLHRCALRDQPSDAWASARTDQPGIHPTRWLGWKNGSAR